MANYVKQLSRFFQRLKTVTEVLIGSRKMTSAPLNSRALSNNDGEGNEKVKKVMDY